MYRTFLPEMLAKRYILFFYAKNLHIYISTVVDSAFYVPYTKKTDNSCLEFLNLVLWR